ncbi:MAG: alpha/beta hydrolase [Phycisphaerae bacterium]
MPLIRAGFYAKTLAKDVELTALLPDGPGPHPVLYLLHGLSDDHTGWLRRTTVERMASARKLAVVMPDGGRGFYTNHDAGPAWADHMLDDVVTFVEQTLPVAREPARRFVGGLSMGGYGALRLALARPGMFASAHSHSGAVMHGSRPSADSRSALKDYELLQIFGQDPTGTPHDLLHLARQAHAAGKLPRLRLDCGRADFLLNDNNAFHDALTQAAVPHEYHLLDGAHDWDYWQQNLPAALDWHLNR